MRDKIERAVIWIGLFLFMFFFLYPFWIALWGSLKSLYVMNQTKVFQPTLNITLEPMRAAFEKLRRPAIHSVIIALTVSLIAIFGGMLGGYALVRGRFRGISVILALVLFGIYIPGATKLLPTLRIIMFLGIYDTPFAVGLSVGSMMLPMSTILYRQFYQQFPKSFYEVAVIAGGNHLDIFGKIVVPMSKVPTVTVAVLSLGVGWNVFLFPLVLTTGSPEDRPIGVTLSALRAAAEQDGTFNEMLAAGILAAIPPIILFLIAQRYITSGFRSIGGAEK
jgi:ABC-type glycerol-3-phosphate transport system permease component